MKTDFNYYQFFNRKNGRYQLKKKYVFYYTDFSGFAAKLYTIHLFVKKDMNFKLFLSFPEYNSLINKFNEIDIFDPYEDDGIIRYYLESKLPFEIRELLTKILKPFKLKGTYTKPEASDLYAVSDSGGVQCEMNHKKGTFELCLSPEVLDKELFKTESETEFLRLIELMQNWLDLLMNGLMKFYSDENINLEEGITE